MSTTPINLYFQDGCAVRFKVSDAPSLNFDVGTIVYGTADDYTGAYEANALFSEQVFATENKRMVNDFTVHAINYTEAPNDYGTTVPIGG